MGKKRVAAAYIFGEKYKELVQTQVDDELANPSEFVFAPSPNITDNGKLSPREVYNKILEQVFYLSPPEKTKTHRDKVSECWRRGTKLLLEKGENGGFLYTGWVIHHAKSNTGGYCG